MLSTPESQKRPQPSLLSLEQIRERNERLVPGAVLKPCPFDGGIFVMIYMNAPSSDTMEWPHVVCMECGCGQSSIEKWNTRV